MGTSANIQTRAAACTMSTVPGDPLISSSAKDGFCGRANQNQDIEILTYVTEGTYDTVMAESAGEGAVHRTGPLRDTVESEVESLTAATSVRRPLKPRPSPPATRGISAKQNWEDEVKRLTALERAYHGRSAGGLDYLGAPALPPAPPKRTDRSGTHCTTG